MYLYYYNYYGLNLVILKTIIHNDIINIIMIKYCSFKNKDIQKWKYHIIILEQYQIIFTISKYYCCHITLLIIILWLLILFFSTFFKYFLYDLQ